MLTMDKLKCTLSRRRCSDVHDLGRFSSSKMSLQLDDLFKSPALEMRKRKRHKTDEDSISLQSFDSNKGPRRKRRSLAKVTSLANLLSPITPVKKVGNALQQKSMSLRNLISPSGRSSGSSGLTGSTVNGTSVPIASCSSYRGPAPTPPKRRESTFWYQTVDINACSKFSSHELERQEAIFELYRTEEDLIEDLNMVKITYKESMTKLHILTSEESNIIFGHIDTLVPIHQELVERLREQRLPDGRTESVGPALHAWVDRLDFYTSYCANQVLAKHLLDRKKQEPEVDDFLQRCQDSPFSRRLDLWSFLDVPRTRLVKYPLLFRSIQKLTERGHADVALLESATLRVEALIARVDQCAGRAKCQHTRDLLHFIDDKQRSAADHLLQAAHTLVCDGVLKNNRGTKLNAFLFDGLLVLSRPATRGQQLHYQVYRQPIPVSQLIVEDVLDGQGKSGSFRSAFSNNTSSRNMFRVSFADTSAGQAHTLIASDAHDKKKWLQCLHEVIADYERSRTPPPVIARLPLDDERACGFLSPTTLHEIDLDALERDQSHTEPPAAAALSDDCSSLDRTLVRSTRAPLAEPDDQAEEQEYDEEDGENVEPPPPPLPPRAPAAGTARAQKRRSSGASLHGVSGGAKRRLSNSAGNSRTSLRRKSSSASLCASRA